MDKKLADALEQHNLVLWSRDGKHYAVTDRHGHEAGTEHPISEHEFEEFKKLGAKVEHTPHQVNG
jgi:hypothetical protein